jgi:hypothetical protein
MAVASSQPGGRLVDLHNAQEEAVAESDLLPIRWHRKLHVDAA